MPIDIIPVGAVIEEAEPLAAATEDVPPAKRGRGRPKGSLNKPKVLDPPPEEEQEEPEEQEEEPEEQEEEPEEQEEEEEEEEPPTPPPKPKRRRPAPVVVAKAKPKPKPIVRAETPSHPRRLVHAGHEYSGNTESIASTNIPNGKITSHLCCIDLCTESKEACPWAPERHMHHHAMLQ